MTFNDYITKRRQAFSFVETNKDIAVGAVTLQQGLDLPVDDLAIRRVASAGGDFDLADIVVNMAIVIGLDGEFPLADRYRALVGAFAKEPSQFCLAAAINAIVVKDWPAAIGLLNSAIQFDDSHVTAYYELGRLYYAMYADSVDVDGLLPRAKRALEIANGIEERADVYYYLAFVCFHMSAFGLAYQHAERAMVMGLSDDLKDDLIPKLAVFEDRATYERGYQHVIDQRYQEGLEALKCISEDGQDDWRVQFFTGVAHRAMGQASQAIGHFNKARDLNPAEASIYRELATCFTMVGDLRHAKSMLAEALKLDADNVDALYQMAVLQYSSEQYDLAEQFLGLALELADEPRFSDLAQAIAERRHDDR